MVACLTLHELYKCRVRPPRIHILVTTERPTVVVMRKYAEKSNGFMFKMYGSENV